MAHLCDREAAGPFPSRERAEAPHDPRDRARPTPDTGFEPPADAPGRVWRDARQTLTVVRIIT